MKTELVLEACFELHRFLEAISYDVCKMGIEYLKENIEEENAPEFKNLRIELEDEELKEGDELIVVGQGRLVDGVKLEIVK